MPEGHGLPAFLQLSSTTSPTYTPEMMATKDVQLADFDKDQDLDVFVPHSRGGPNQPDFVYINRMNETEDTLVKTTTPVNHPGQPGPGVDDHDGMGNNLCASFPPCEFETTYESLVIDIGGPNGTGPDTWPDIITVNGADFMRVLINQQCQGACLVNGQCAPGCFPNFIDEAGSLVISGPGWIANSADTTSRIYNCQSSGTDCTKATDLLGPLVSTRSTFDELTQKQTSLDDIDAADIDGDGDMDLFLSNRDGSGIGMADFRKHNFILRNRDLGSFDIFEMNGSDPINQEDVNIVTHDSAFGDYDGDGDPDLLNANDNADAKLWRNRRGEIPTPANPADYFVDVTAEAGISAFGCAHAAFVDLNQDGRLDIHLDGCQAIYWNNGGTPVSFTWSPGLFLYSAAYADLNGDSWIDIVGANGSRGRVFLSCTNANGAITFREAQAALPPLGDPVWDPPTYGVALGDLDLDGDLDIVFGEGDGGGQYRNLVFLNQLVP